MNLPRMCKVFMLFGMSVAAHAANSVVSLSHYDEKIDLSKLQQSGLQAVIHEATYPASDCDAKYGHRQGEAARTGLLWGAYHFGNNTDGRRQADHYLNFIASRPHPSGVLLVLDAEQNTHYPGGSMSVAQAVRFIERVHDRTGIYPGLYSNENWIRKVFNNPSIDAGARRTLCKSWLWIANYHKQPRATAPWSRWSLWQYTGDGVCDLPRSSYPTSLGGARKIERTIFSGDHASLRRFWSQHAWQPTRGLVAME